MHRKSSYCTHTEHKDSLCRWDDKVSNEILFSPASALYESKCPVTLTKKHGLQRLSERSPMHCAPRSTRCDGNGVMPIHRTLQAVRMITVTQPQYPPTLTVTVSAAYPFTVTSNLTHILLQTDAQGFFDQPVCHLNF